MADEKNIPEGLENLADEATEQLTEAAAETAEVAASPFDTPYTPPQDSFQTTSTTQAPYDGVRPATQPTQVMPQQIFDATQQAGYQQTAGTAPQAYPAQGTYQQPGVAPGAPVYQNGSNPGTTPLVLGILSIVFAGIVGLILSIMA